MAGSFITFVEKGNLGLIRFTREKAMNVINDAMAKDLHRILDEN